MADHVKDMTIGKPAGLILSFALPLMIGNVFQQLYTIVDTMIVGQFIGVEALAALGAVEWIHWLVLGIITGNTQGFSILIAQRFGADDRPGLRKSVTMTVELSLIIGVAATIFSLMFVRPVLQFLNTPENIMTDAIQYISVLFGGILVVTAYNICASILRALGNSRVPLIAMVIAAVINIVLDLLFVVVFHWGVIGAAAATVIAQVFSAAFCLCVLLRMPILKADREDWRPDKSVIGKLIKLGLPMAFQNVIISVGGMTVQYVINGYGFLFVAGFTATNKLYGLLEVAATSFGFSMATYTGQNLGAGRLDRIKTGMRSARRMAIVTALIISAAMILFGRPILKLFISGTPDEIEAVADVAYHYLVIMSALLFILYLLYVYRSALQGMGDTITPMVSGIVEMVMRTLIVFLLPLAIGKEGVYYAEDAAWIGATVLLMAMYYYRIHKLSESPSKPAVTS